MPCLPSTCTRAARVEQQLCLPDATLHALSQQTALQPALQPFRSPRGLYELAAYVHAFGVPGPAVADWHRLFAACAHLHAEQIAVLVACVAVLPRKNRAWKDALRDALFGSDIAPGVLDPICDKFDDWLVRADRVSDAIVSLVDRHVHGWSVAAVVHADGLCFRWSRFDQLQTACARDRLGLVDVVRMNAEAIAVAVTRTVVAALMERASVGAFGGAIDKLEEKWLLLFDAARRCAFAKLAESVFECLRVGV